MMVIGVKKLSFCGSVDLVIPRLIPKRTVYNSGVANIVTL